MAIEKDKLEKVLMFIGLKEPMKKFRLDIRSHGFSQDQFITEKIAEEFKKFLEQQGSFNLKSEDGDNGSDNDLYYYRGWGGFRYIYLVAYSNIAKINFAVALIEFAKNKGEVIIKEESMVLQLN